MDFGLTYTTNSLQKNYPIKPESLDMQNYFESLTMQAHKAGLLSTAQLESIQYKSAEVLAEQTKAFAGCDNSSVKIETAQAILKSIFYCISVSLKSCHSVDIAVEALKSTSINELFINGKQLIKKQINSAKKLYSAVRQNMLVTENLAYKNSIDAMDEFFKKYDADYFANETPAGMIDYPLAFVPFELSGIEYIYDYLKRMYWENYFCSYFKAQNIESLLLAYSENYADLLINIFSLVLTNALGCTILQKDILMLDITANELELLQNRLYDLAPEELNGKLKNAAEKLLGILKITSKVMLDYTLETINAISPQIYNTIKNKQAEKVFISFKFEQNKALYGFADNAKMEDDLFKKITDEIRECRYVSDKLAIIKSKVHSIADLADIFGADCIYGEEYAVIFNSLSELELALLLKQLSYYDEAFNNTEGENEWYGILKQYLSKIDTLQQDRIKEIYNNTDLL